MLKTIIRREIQHNLYSLRFQIALGVTIVIFIIGTLSFVKTHTSNLDKYMEYQRQYIEEIQSQAQSNGGILATRRKTYMLHPRENSFISDCKEKYLPNGIVFNAYNVYSFENRHGSANPILPQFQELNWSFIVTLVISFIVLLFTFDTISGEKESKTLTITLANSFSRGTLLLGKYISTIVTSMFITFLGMILSVLIIIFSNQIVISTAFALELIGFIILLFFLISSIAAFGLLSSVLVRKSNVSLLIALTIWLFFSVVIPNSSIFIAKKIFSIEHEETIREKIKQVFEDLDRNAPPGSWASNSSQPFAPEHKLRADLQMMRMNAEKDIRDKHYRDMFRQFERTRMLTVVSPVNLFDYMAEAVVGGGYVRFRKVWDDFHIYQSQFLAFFKEFDSQDTDSPHWYNPNEDVSTTRKPVAFENVPLFEEKPMSLPDRLSSVLKYLVVSIIYTAVIFFLTFVLFVRYDVR